MSLAWTDCQAIPSSRGSFLFQLQIQFFFKGKPPDGCLGLQGPGI